MPLPFRRTDPRRAQLEQLRRRITDLENAIGVLASAAEAGDLDDVPEENADIYQSMARLRENMVRRDVQTRRNQLDEVIREEAQLALQLRVPPFRQAEKPVIAPPPSPERENGAAALEGVTAYSAKTAPVEPTAAANPDASVEPPSVLDPAPAVERAATEGIPVGIEEGPSEAAAAEPAPASMAAAASAPVLAAPEAAASPPAAPVPARGRRAQRAPAPTQKAARKAKPAKTPAPPVQARRRRPSVGFVLISVVTIVLALAVAIALSGLLDIDPGRAYGPLSDAARALQTIVSLRGTSAR